MTRTLLCIGNITVDESVQPDGERTTALGGDAIFAALAARTVADDVAWLAPVGNDFPAAMATQLNAAGLTLDGLPRRDFPTVRNVVTYAPDGSRSWEMQCSEAAFDAMSVYPRDVPAALLGARGILVTAMSLRSQCVLLPWLRERSTASLYLDLQEDYIPGHEDELLSLIASCDAFLPSEIEARLLTGTPDVVAAARAFRDLGPRCVVIKLAERGCVVLGDDEVVEVPTDPVTPVDSTGAGDAFCGAFAARHVVSGDPVDAARVATHAARVAISGFGVNGLLAGRAAA